MIFFLLLVSGRAMYHKRQRGWDPDAVAPHARFRHRTVDQFLSNAIPAIEAQSLLNDALAAGTLNVSDLASKSNHPNHARRQLMGKLENTCKWPIVYWAEVRVWDTKKQCTTKAKIPILLPHEVLHALVSVKTTDLLFSSDGATDTARSHLEYVRARLPGNPANLIGLSLWGDGVPCNYDRTESLEVISLSFPGLTGEAANLRIPVAAIKKCHVVKHQTFDDIYKVIVWSLEAAAQNRMPSCRHDGEPWNPSDRKSGRFASPTRARVTDAGKPIGAFAALTEMRGDWAFYKEVFRFPGWRENRGHRSSTYLHITPIAAEDLYKNMLLN